MSAPIDSPFDAKLDDKTLSTSGAPIDHLGYPATYGSVAPIDYMPLSTQTYSPDSPFTDKFQDMTTLPMNSVDQIRPSGGTAECDSPFTDKLQGY